MLVGYCDDLATAQALGPFRDLVGSVGAELSRAITGGDRDQVLAALRAELSWAAHPTVLVIEDVHWADDATLDALRYLIRRVAGLPAVLVLTYRDDAAEPGASPAWAARPGVPQRPRPAPAAAPGCPRMRCASSARAARLMPMTCSRSPRAIPSSSVSCWPRRRRSGFRARSWTPFLARVRQLDPPVQDVLEQLAVVPSAVEPWLFDALVPGGVPARVTALVAAEQAGLLTVSARRISFTHELTRRAVADSLPSARLMALNRRVLAALVNRDGCDAGRIVHHAARAGDVDAIVRYGPAAARDAARAGAHREAVAHYGLVLEQAAGSPRTSEPGCSSSTRSSATRSARRDGRPMPSGRLSS